MCKTILNVMLVNFIFEILIKRYCKNCDIFLTPDNGLCLCVAGMSEDSDYTSDINYPLPHQHNSSAHQFRGEPNYPLHRDAPRDPRHPGYTEYQDSFDRDESGEEQIYDPMDGYERRGSYDRGDSFERRSIGREEMYERGDSYERTESFEQDYDRRSDIYDYERSDTEYERSVQDDRFDGRYVREGERYNYGDYDRRDYDEQSRHSSNRDYDYDDDPDYMYSNEEYERTLTNDESIKSDRERDRYRSTDPPDSRHSDSHYERDSRYDSQERLSDIYSRESQHGRDPTSPYHGPGRSDTDSEILSYNSRPYPRHIPAANNQRQG